MGAGVGVACVHACACVCVCVCERERQRDRDRRREPESVWTGVGQQSPHGDAGATWLCDLGHNLQPL